MISSSSFKKLGSEKRSTTLAYMHFLKKKRNGEMGRDVELGRIKQSLIPCRQNARRVDFYVVTMSGFVHLYPRPI